MSEYTTIEALQRLSEPDEEFAKVFDPSLLPARYPELEAGREKMLEHDTQAATAMRCDEVITATRMITMRDGYESELRIFTPSKIPASGAPLVILYYGGGFIFGNNLQCANYATTITRLFSAVVVLPSYRLAPEHPFPTAPNDAWDSFVWIAMNAASLGADPSLGFIIGGRSAGGTLSAVIAQKALSEDFKGPRITGTWLSMPMLLSERCVTQEEKGLWVSRAQNANSPQFNTAMIGVLMDAWKPDELSPLFSPFNVEKGAQRGVPTTYFQICGLDPLRDDAFIYERLLRRNDVKTMMDVYPGVPHGVTMPFPHLAASKKLQVDVIVRIGQMLGRDVDRSVVEQVFPWPSIDDSGPWNAAARSK